MIRTLRLLLCGLVFCIAFTGCSKEYSEENGGTPGSGTPDGSSSGTAVFTLGGAPNACTTPLVSGIYKQGVAMDATNTVVVTVDVTTIGTYVIATASINGVTFSGSGTFVVTGSQAVVLTGNGTPTQAGSFTYKPGSNGCTFPLVVTSGSTVTDAVGTLDCAAATLAGTYTQGILLTASNTVTIPVNVTTAGTYSINSSVVNGVTFSGSGNLALGNQTIVLTGNGLPTNSGAVSFSITLGTSNCSFPITFIAGTPPAEGTLDCASATVDGTYTQGVALDASNTITIDVNVTLAGPYAITTTQINGVSFSGSGTLALGNQTIVLTGSGTPNSSGTFAMPVGLGTSSCSVDIDFIAGSTDFLKCSINGGPIINFSSLSGSLVPGNFGVSGATATEDLQITVTDVGGGNIGVNTYHNLSATNTSIFCSTTLTIGSTSYFDIDAMASSNIFTVNITSITPTTVNGTFNGKLTDLIGGGTRNITNGSFSITY